MQKGEIARLIAPVKKREEELVERVAFWSEINSGTHHAAGVARMAELLSEALEELSSNTATVSFPPVEELQDDGAPVRHSLGPGVRAHCRAHAPIQVLLNGHLDTVFGPEHPFQRTRRERDRLVGPGVADMKGGLLVMIEALRILESAPFRDRVGWQVILNPDEEIGSPASARMLTEAASRFRVGMVFEPALPDGSLVSARPGIGNFLVQVRGRAAHVGREFAQGRSAVVAVAKLISAFDLLNREPGVILNVGRVAGGGPVNVVPDHASCRLNVRVESDEMARQTEARIRERVGELDRQDGFRAEVSGGFTRPPKPKTAAVETLLEAFRTCADEIGFALNWAPTGGGSDGNLLAAAGLPTIDSLGVRGGGIHTDGEFLEVASLVERIALSARFLLKLARGDLVLPGPGAARGEGRNGQSAPTF